MLCAILPICKPICLFDAHHTEFTLFYVIFEIRNSKFQFFSILIQSLTVSLKGNTHMSFLLDINAIFPSKIGILVRIIVYKNKRRKSWVIPRKSIFIIFKNCIDRYLCFTICASSIVVLFLLFWWVLLFSLSFIFHSVFVFFLSISLILTWWIKYMRPERWSQMVHEYGFSPSTQVNRRMQGERSWVMHSLRSI